MSRRSTRRRTEYVLYLAVLPVYRNECMKLMRDSLGLGLTCFASPSHLDPSVRTGIDSALYTSVRISRLGRVAFLQRGHWNAALRAHTTVLDLNPRSLTAWLLLLGRRALRRRTLLWGHLHPQKGGASPTAWLRQGMTMLASGVVTYTYTQQSEADRTGRRAWVAPNSLYRRGDITPGNRLGAHRDTILYVGRLEPEKKVSLLVEAFAHAVHHGNLQAVLRLVGGGSEEERLHVLVRHHGVEDLVRFDGNITSVDRLRELYGSAICSTSPGFVGLGLTQSLGFGVPQIVARGEPHSPEVELARLGGVRWFDSNDVKGLAAALVDAQADAQLLPLHAISSSVRERYSAEAMADGLVDALHDRHDSPRSISA